MRVQMMSLISLATLLACCVGVPTRYSMRNDLDQMSELQPFVRASRARRFDITNSAWWITWGYRGSAPSYDPPLNPAETVPIKRQATGVEAMITKKVLDKKIGSDTYGIPDFSPGFIELRDNGLCPHRGHLLAKELGGSGLDVRNIVTLTELANLKTMRPWETLVAKAWQTGKVSEKCVIIYNVTAGYITNQLHPKSITIIAKVLNPFTSDITPWFYVRFLNVPRATEQLSETEVTEPRIVCTPSPTPTPPPRPFVPPRHPGVVFVKLPFAIKSNASLPSA